MVAFFGSGTLIVWRIRQKRYKFFWALTVSYAHLLLVVLMMSVIPGHYGKIIALSYALPLACLIIDRLALAFRHFQSGSGGHFSTGPIKSVFSQWLSITAGAVIILVIWWLGPYNEIPSDFWAHLESINTHKKSFDTGFFQPGNPWYLIIGFLWHLTGIDSFQMIEVFYLFSTSVFVLGLFLLFGEIACKTLGQKVGVFWAALGTWFVSITFGMGEFAYVRYYFAAPGFFAYLIFLFYVWTLQVQTARTMWFSVAFGLILSFFLYFIHKQEALFIGIISGIWAILAVSRNISTKQVCRFVIGGPMLRARSKAIAPITISWASLILLVLSILMWFVFEPSDSIDGCLASGYCIAVNVLEWGEVVIGNAGYNFWKSFGLLGILAVGAAFWDRSPSAARSRVLAMGVFVTFFNPGYVSFFLSNISGEVLWRHAYMFPAGVVLVQASLNFAGRGLGATELGKRWSIRPNLIRVIFGFAIVVTLASMSMFSNKNLTLKKVDEASSPAFYKDLISYLEQFESDTHALTDPVTGYMLSGLTDISHARWKFHKINYIEFNAPNYSKKNYFDYVGWLLIINERDGGESILGLVSGHWPSDILKLSRYYDPEFVAHVNQTPSRFKKLWSEDRIAVFRIVDE